MEEPRSLGDMLAGLVALGRNGAERALLEGALRRLDATHGLGRKITAEFEVGAIIQTLARPTFSSWPCPISTLHEGVGDLVPGITPLDSADGSRAVRFRLEQPPNLSVFEILPRPTN
jgi:hypothetical protein